MAPHNHTLTVVRTELVRIPRLPVLLKCQLRQVFGMWMFRPELIQVQEVRPVPSVNSPVRVRIGSTVAPVSLVVTVIVGAVHGPSITILSVWWEAMKLKPAMLFEIGLMVRFSWQAEATAVLAAALTDKASPTFARIV